mgnify:CR=1 FL=1
MANIKSQKKRNITNEKARLRNRAVRSELKTATRAVQEAVKVNDAETAEKKLFMPASFSTKRLPKA